MGERREKLFNMRVSEEEDDRFRRVAKHLSLDVSQVVRMMFAEAERKAVGNPNPSEAIDRAASAWEMAHASFVETGVGETLGRIIVNRERVRVTLSALDKVMAAAKQSGEPEVASSLGRFRVAVSAFQALHKKERAEHTKQFIALILAYAEASRQMFSWATRRTAI